MWMNTERWLKSCGQGKLEVFGGKVIFKVKVVSQVITILLSIITIHRRNREMFFKLLFVSFIGITERDP
jgi:hypothetical protein